MKRSLIETISVVCAIAILCGGSYAAGYAHRGYVDEVLRHHEKEASKFKIEWGDKK